ncbi:MAG TPA: GNAT family N-acetyltransferase [Gemmataceae bacterium]|nr:GNAT family N-acetyltransferase [Gemmataceae bacterium]
MRIEVDSQFHLSEFQAEDVAALIEYLNDRDIHERTLRIPYPYTAADAAEWLALAEKITQQQGRPINFAIRNRDRGLIGGVGFDGFQLGESHRAEIGYWLARPFWGRGIMSAVVERVCQHAFGEFGLVKISAHVFTSNPGSGRVLQKCGFVQEGLLRKHYLKNGSLIDAWLFARIRS